MDFGENQIFGCAPKGGVNAVSILGQDEQLGAIKAGDQAVTHLGRGFAASQPVDIDPRSMRNCRSPASSVQLGEGGSWPKAASVHKAVQGQREKP
jgi:hypothetical protein